MTDDQKRRVLKFSIGSLLAITAAVAVGLAVSLSSPRELAPWEVDMRWQQGLMCGGLVLLVSELVLQAVCLLRQARSSKAETRAALVFASSLRFTISGILGVLVALQLLFNRQVISEIQRVYYPRVYIEFWPRLMLTIATLVAIRILLLDHKRQNQSTIRDVVMSAVVLLGLATIALFVITDRSEEVAITHFASNAVEINSPIALHRTGVFPHHAAEGFRSFWSSFAATVAVTIAGILLWLRVTINQPSLRILMNTMFFMLIGSAGAYVSWFLNHEFPRISPDYASNTTPRLWSDNIAGFTLLIGLSIVLGFWLAKRCTNNNGPGISLPKISNIGLIASCLITIASGCEVNILLCQWTVEDSPRSVLSFLLWYLPLPQWHSFQNYVGTFGEAILQPEILLSLALFGSALTLTWQAIRQPGEQSPLQPVTGRDLIGCTLAALMWLLVAIPTLATFAFCYWLGPFVL